MTRIQNLVLPLVLLGSLLLVFFFIFYLPSANLGPTYPRRLNPLIVALFGYSLALLLIIIKHFLFDLFWLIFSMLYYINVLLRVSTMKITSRVLPLGVKIAVYQFWTILNFLE
ncbi:hypothetical protein ACJX0J_037933 [Zea mays]